jgi:hypothetical protein
LLFILCANGSVRPEQAFGQEETCQIKEEKGPAAATVGEEEAMAAEAVEADMGEVEEEATVAEEDMVADTEAAEEKEALNETAARYRSKKDKRSK